MVSSEEPQRRGEVLRSSVTLYFFFPRASLFSHDDFGFNPSPPSLLVVVVFFLLLTTHFMAPSHPFHAHFMSGPPPGPQPPSTRPGYNQLHRGATQWQQGEQHRGGGAATEARGARRSSSTHHPDGRESRGHQGFSGIPVREGDECQDADG